MKMFNKLKTRLSQMAVAFTVMIGFSAFAATPQTYLSTSTTASLVNVPTSIAASTTATNGEVIDVTRHDWIGIQVTANLVSTNPASQALTIPIRRSLDGTTFETTATTTLSLTLDGTLTRMFYTNMNVGAARYLKFDTFINGTTNIATNIVVKFSGKPPWSTVVAPVVQ